LPKVPGTGVDIPHHQLGFGGVGVEWDAAGSLDLIGDPVPVADALECNGGSFGELSEEAMYSSGLVVDPCLADDMAAIVLHLDL